MPVLGGGTRFIEPLPWDLAQLPFADQSAAFGAALVQQLTARGIPLNGRPAVTAPLRAPVGANMPAVLIEAAFLTNAEDEQALTGGDLQSALVDAIVAVIADMRRGIPAPDSRRGGQ